MVEISADEAAVILGITRRQVGYLVRIGTLTARKINDKKNAAYQIDKASVLAYQQVDRRRGPKHKHVTLA